MPRLAPVVALLMAAVAASSAQAATNLVVNGSFEADGGPLNSWFIAPTLQGWTGAPDIEVQSNIAGNSAQDGLYLVELDTTVNSAMTQVIQATGLVQLSFWYSARAFTAAGTNTLTYSFGSLSGTLLANDVGINTTVWRQFSGVVDLGTSGSATLRFAAAGTEDQFGGLLDNVSVTAVPEPATTALLLAGLGLVGAAAAKRRAR